MITAAEAREILKNSDAEVERHLGNICKYIEAQATAGKQWMYLANTAPYDIAFGVVDPVAYGSVEFTPLQKRLKESLEKLGFGMRIESEKYDRNKGRGAIDPDGPEDIATRYYIIISW